MTTSMQLIVAIVVFSILIIILVVFVSERRLDKLRLIIEQERTKSERKAQEIAKQLFDQWTQSSIDTIRKQITDTLKSDYEVQLSAWKKREEETIRKDAIQKSINALLGKIGEEFSPVFFSNRFGINLKDFRHLGTPVDFVAFRGLSEGSEDVEVLFLEIKSGKVSGLAERERRVRNAVSEKRVRYEVVNINDMVANFKNETNGSSSKL